jgi:hypothetical protein
MRSEPEGEWFGDLSGDATSALIGKAAFASIAVLVPAG